MICTISTTCLHPTNVNHTIRWISLESMEQYIFMKFIHTNWYSQISLIFRFSDVIQEWREWSMGICFANNHIPFRRFVNTYMILSRWKFISFTQNRNFFFRNIFCIHVRHGQEFSIFLSDCHMKKHVPFKLSTYCGLVMQYGHINLG